MPKPLDSVTAGKQIMCETRRQFEKAGFTERAIAKELAGIAFTKISAKKVRLHDKLQALGMAVDVIGIKKPTKIDVNHSGSIMAAVASHLSQAPEKVEKGVKEDTGKAKKSQPKPTSRAKKR